MTVIDSTISGNATAGVGLLEGGGGIANIVGGTLTVTDSTFSNNAANGGGGIFNGGKLTVTMTLFDNRAGGNVRLDPVNANIFASRGHNLFSDAPGVALDPTDLINTDPRLGPLADNGGPTFTQALLPGSPAIDAGVSVPGVTTDQRGVPRPQGTAPDIGAFEFQPVVGLRRLGVHRQPTTLVLTFGASLDPASAQDVRNYTLVPTEPGGRSRPHARPIPIASAVYDPAAQSVTLAPRHRLALHGYYRLTVNGTSPAGVRSTGGLFLNEWGKGQPGSDYVAIVHGFGTADPGRTAQSRPGRRAR
jgi:hypothetical protein